MSFKQGDLIRFPDPLEDGRTVQGRFQEVAADQPIEVPSPEGGTRLTDAAWVSRDDNTTARVPYSSIRPV